MNDPEAKAFIALVESQADLARLTAGPANIPPERLAALRTAYDKAMADPGLRAKAEKAGRPIEALSGKDVEQRIRTALNQPPRTIALIKQAMSAEGVTVEVKGKIKSLADRNKEFKLTTADGKTIAGEISGSRTKISIKGSTAKRDDLKVGMSCTMISDQGAAEADALTCN